MTQKVIETLNLLKDIDVFEQGVYFVGGTALAYYLKHRISEDIDIITKGAVNYKKIKPLMKQAGAIEIQDESYHRLRIAGLFPDEYILKFSLNNVKIEFFRASTPSHLTILTFANSSFYEKTNITILDLQTIAKLKILALINRDKARDIFDFQAILQNDVLTNDEILKITHAKHIHTWEALMQVILKKEKQKDDEAVYFSETQKIDLSWDEIKSCAIKTMQSRIATQH